MYRDARSTQPHTSSRKHVARSARPWLSVESRRFRRPSKRPDAVRHKSVDTATQDLQRYKVTHGGTRRKRPAQLGIRS